MRELLRELFYGFAKGGYRFVRAKTASFTYGIQRVTHSARRVGFGLLLFFSSAFLFFNCPAQTPVTISTVSLYGQLTGTNVFEIPNGTFDPFGAAQQATNTLAAWLPSASVNLATYSYFLVPTPGGYSTNAVFVQGITDTNRITGAFTRLLGGDYLSTNVSTHAFTYADTNGNYTASGTITGGGFTGPATGLTSLNASQLTSGTVPTAQLPVATTGSPGMVQPDGTTITISGGVISAVSGGVVTNNLWTATGNFIYPSANTGSGGGWVSSGQTIYPQ